MDEGRSRHRRRLVEARAEATDRPGAETSESGEVHQVWEEAETLADHFRETLISLRGMDLWPRRATVVAIAGIVIAALLMATRELPGPAVPTGDGGSIPLVQLVGCALLATVAWSYLLAGVLHAHWGLRLPVAILYTLMGLTLVVQGVPDVAAGAYALWYLASRLRHPLSPHQDLEIARLLAGDLPLPLLALGVLGLLAAVWVVVLRHGGRERRAGAPPRLGLGILLACTAVTGSLFALESVGSAFGSAYPIASALGEQLTLFGFTILPLVLFVTGSDFAEWAEVVAGKAIAGLRPLHPAVVPAIAIVAALAMLFDSARVAGGVRALAGQLLPTLVLGLVGVVLGRLLLVRARPLRVPLAGLLAAGLLAYLLSIMPPLSGVAFYLWVVGVVLAILGALVAGRRRPALAVPALLMGLVLVVALLADWYQGGRAVLTPDRLRSGGALVCLGAVAIALARYRLGRRGQELVRLGLVLALGLQGLDWLSDLFQVTSALQLAPLQASVMLLGLLWDVTTSGESVTNIHGRRVPHHSRVLVYFGYELLAATAIVWFYASTDSEAFRDTDSWVSGGIQLLGAPLLMVFFGLGLVSWMRAGRTPSEELAAEVLAKE